MRVGVGMGTNAAKTDVHTPKKLHVISSQYDTGYSLNCWRRQKIKHFSEKI